MERRRFQWPVLRRTRDIHAHFAFVAASIIVISVCGAAVNGQMNTTTTTTAQTVCPAVTECLNDTLCANCLRLLNLSITSDEASALKIHLRSPQKAFFSDLIGPTCSINGTVMPLVVAAGNEINSRPCHAMGPNAPISDSCLTTEFQCALNLECQQCLVGIYTANDNKTSALNSPSCLALSGIGVSLQIFSNCYAFPQCTWAKLECDDDATQKCANCLSMVRDGDVTNAVQECNPSTTSNSSILLDNVASNCMAYTDVTCSYFKARCDQSATCGSCLTDIGGAQTAQDVARSFLDSSYCMSMFGNSSSSVLTNQMLFNVFNLCPTSEVTACQAATFTCILISDGECATCLAGSASQQNDPSCKTLLDQYVIDSSCQPCDRSVIENNHIVLATSVVGGMSVVPCLFVILAIVAYGKDIMYIRARIIIGLMLSNIVYSIGNAIPVALLQTNLSTCGQTVLSFNTMRFGRAWWFAGKYALVFFELFILGVAVWSLKSGLHTLGVRRETLLHATCAVAGFAAFVGFFVKSGEIESKGFNTDTQAELKSDAFSYLGAGDDFDDDAPNLSAGRRFTKGRNMYDTLVQQMLQVWIAFLVLCILLWFNLRYTFARLSQRWRVDLSEAEDQWNRDLCATDLQGVRKTKRRFLELTKETYDELFRPLEPFVAVFFVFGVPACVMATDYCHEHSQVSAKLEGDAAVIKVGKCDAVCELILSFRSSATVAVYFYSREHRNEVYHVRTLWRRLRARVTSWFLPSNRRHASGVRFRGLMLEEVKMIPGRGDDVNDDVDIDADDGSTGATVPYKLMDDDEGGGGHSSSQL
jgi:hypothetical protein